MDVERVRTLPPVHFPSSELNPENSRIHQLRNAQEQLARSHDLPIIDFGGLIEGFQVHQEKIHPLFNPGVVLPHAFVHQVKRLDDRRRAGPLGGWREKLHLV